MVAALEGKQISAVEALAALANRVEARNPEINVVVTTDFERARSRAAATDQARAAGHDVGPLAGLPMTVKDSLMTEGMRTTSGKTNLPIYAGDMQSYNEVFGTSNNRWDVTKSVGGSSGSAGALAAGFTPLEVGSDIGGSIRNPAAMCGVVGHKPSYGIVSAKGQIPGPPGTLTQADIAVVGPMARTVEDCRLGLDLLAGADDWHEEAWTLELPPARQSGPQGLRVAVWANDPHCPVDPEIESAINDMAVKLGAAGARVDTTARPHGFDFAKADRTFGQLIGAALCGGWSFLGPTHRPSGRWPLPGGSHLSGGGGHYRGHRRWDPSPPWLVGKAAQEPGLQVPGLLRNPGFRNPGCRERPTTGRRTRSLRLPGCFA